MKLEEVREILDARILAGDMSIVGERSISIERVFASDLMSDVLAFAEEKTMLLTGLTNLQVIRTSEMLDIDVVVFVRGKVPGKEIIKLANEKEVTLLATSQGMYTACGKLFQRGLKGVDD